ncbi:DUF4179 domain-containing protein [Sporosarcina obsidiansis]|uniref:DUF4179 domain-containing protein n=1 Tax=Sporosarcina obsidiansis TaxID=2660748 RepID=UPI00129AFB0C|nr:DUF4179 domain-containing protein [Sporosarcina obsidiansis]
MTELERQLVEEKKRLDEVTAPEELEGRLRAALEKMPKRKKSRMPHWVSVTAALLVLSLVAYQYNAFAYYGKKLLGFEEIMSTTLAELNESGNGQTIDKKVLLADGSELTVDGILTDENQFVLYYTLSNPKGLKEDISFMELTGLFTHSFSRSGTSTTNEEGTELKGMWTFEPVSPFAKKLTLEFHDSTSQDWVEVTFPYNPSAAMRTELKQSIKKSVQVDQGSIRFNSITATPSQTTIKGKLKVDNFDRIPLGFYGVKLLANGMPYEQISGGVTSAINGNVFTIDYDALPKDLDSLAIAVDTFVGYKQVDETIFLHSRKETSADLEGEEVIIRKMEVTSEGLEITVVTEENILLDGVAVQVNDYKVPLQTTLKQEYVSTESGKENKERVLLFDTEQLPDAILIKGLHYEKKYHEVIDIPLRK